MRSLRLFEATLAGVAIVLLPSASRGQPRRCEAVRVGEPLPLAMQLVDSMALAAALPARSFPPTTFSLWYGITGQLTHVMALADTVVVSGAARADSAARMRAELGTLIAGAAFPQEAAVDMALRLTVARDSAGALLLSVAPSIRCSPQARSQFHPPNERITATREEIDEYQHATPALVTFVVDTAGHPLQVLLERSSGSRLIDAHVIESITGSRYQPGTVDGFPKVTSARVTVLPPIPAWRHGP